MALTKIDDRGLKTPIDLLDDEKIRFGTSDDLEIFHGGGHSKIFNANGNIYISNESGNSSNIVLQATWGEESVIAKHNAEVELYYDNSLKLETGSGGIVVHGSYYTNDNNKIYLGSDNDLSLFHDGSHARIYNTTGVLQIRTATGFQVRNSDGSETIIETAVDGAVKLYYDGSKKIETKSYGVNMPDNSQLYFGTGDDLLIKHDGSNSYLSNATGNLYIYTTTNNSVTIGKSGEISIKAVPDAAVELYYDNSKKFATTSGGVHIYNELNTSGAIGIGNSADLTFEDNGKAKFGFGADFQLYHDGSVNRIVGTGAHDIEVYTSNTKRFTIGSNGNTTYLDNVKSIYGTGSDLRIYHDGSDSYIADTGTGLLVLQTNYLRVNNAAGNETIINAVENGAVELYYDNVKKAATASTGFHIYSGNLSMNDNQKVAIGSSNDLQLYHDGNNSYVEDSGTGSLILKTGRVSFNDTSNNEMGRFDGEGLKFNGDTAAANGLDDYEEGTWNPQLGGDSSDPTQSYATQNGTYTKIGNWVFLSFDVNMASSGISSGSGNLELKNLPFNKDAIQSYGVLFTAGFTANLGTDNPTDAYMNASASFAYLMKRTNTNTGGDDYCVASAVTNSSRIIGSISYRTA